LRLFSLSCILSLENPVALLMGNAQNLAKYPAGAETHNKLHLLTGHVINCPVILNVSRRLHTYNANQWALCVCYLVAILRLYNEGIQLQRILGWR